MEDLDDWRGYGNRTSSTEFLLSLTHHLIHLRSEVSSLEQLAEAGEALLERSSESTSVEVLPWPIRASIVVMLIATLEGDLFNLCKATRDAEGLRLSVTDLGGSSLEKIRLFFKKVANLRFPDRRPCWAEVKLLYKLRNALVHRWGKVNDQTAAELSQMAGVEISEGEVWLSKSAVGSAFRIVREFADELQGHLGGEQNGERQKGCRRRSEPGRPAGPARSAAPNVHSPAASRTAETSEPLT